MIVRYRLTKAGQFGSVLLTSVAVQAKVVSGEAAFRVPGVQ